MLALVAKHGKAGGLALPTALLIAVEMRDMYQRGQWDSPRHITTFHDGDILLISNRWWALPTYRQRFYSLWTKTLLKTTWDDLGVIINDGETGQAMLFIAEPQGVRYVPLTEFLAARDPRGAAVRRIKRAADASMPAPPRQEIVAFVAAQIDKRQVRPWLSIRAAWDIGNFRQQFRWAIEVSMQAVQVRKARMSHSSAAMIQAETDRFHEKLALEQAIVDRLPEAGRAVAFETSNAALVAETLAMLHLVPSPLPPPQLYAPTDFSTGVFPLINHEPSDDRPVIIYKP